MFLKSLTLRGFKSFADKTVLEFEPGVTVVVGPNGSGKSNLVDAVAWVLGAQGPRTLRGGKMDDVIFAGTPDRPALGRAEVSLCIDNTRRPAADRVQRGHDHPHALPRGRLRVPDQRRAVPAARHPGAALRLRHRPAAARHRRPGPARRGAQRPARGPPGDRRRSSRHPEVPQATRAGRASARGHRGQPAAAERPAPRGAPSAHPVAAAGRRRPPPRWAGRGAPGDPPPPGRPRDRGPAGARRAPARPGHRAHGQARRPSGAGCATSTSPCSTPSTRSPRPGTATSPTR